MARQGQIRSCLKSYCDTLLFFYLALLSTRQPGNLLEVGIGGSSFALAEVSTMSNRALHLVDTDRDGLHQVTGCSLFDKHLVKTWCMSSQDLGSKIDDICDLIYCHVDGSKNYHTAKSDLEFCLEHLAPGGLICQDDYGNNKWPTINAVVQELVQQHRAKIVLVGDSSVWITRPDFYSHWMQLIKTDAEMMLLAHFVGMCSAKAVLSVPEDYYFLNAMTTDHVYFDDKDTVMYFDRLLDQYHDGYLTMPYHDQSAPGYFATEIGQRPPYMLCDQTLWDNLRGQDWPTLAPRSRQHIDDLADTIKHEITQQHQIDLYAIDPFHAVFNRKLTKHQGDTA